MTCAIARMTNEGTWVCVQSFDSYSEADIALDDYCEMYPNAYLDIFEDNDD